ncbi:uncharacterized protein LOC109821476 [Asparagus officinalis]|uniref:uncharacterized protein LOC109821476 n=1 Tax=Asparagus officinalis TaxID=4686 RepID=UPI00098E4C36|nr:uncharacterized protein LOC109821476 [Asparagus officinalis]
MVTRPWEPHHPPPRTEPGVREFRYIRPPSLFGAGGPLAVEEFLKVTETILIVTCIAHVEWTDLMDVQLTDTARIWWTVEKTHLVRLISWETFTERFNWKYFPQSSRDELLRQFVKLKQRGRSVDEYEAEFSSLSRYAPHLVTDPTIRRHQFQKGLDKYIKFALASRALATHDVVLDVAREIESVQKWTASTSKKKSKGKGKEKSCYGASAIPEKNDEEIPALPLSEGEQEVLATRSGNEYHYK